MADHSNFRHMLGFLIGNSSRMLMSGVPGLHRRWHLNQTNAARSREHPLTLSKRHRRSNHDHLVTDAYGRAASAALRPDNFRPNHSRDMDTAWFATLSAAIHFGWNACLGLPESIVIRRIAGRAYHAVDHDSCSTPGRVDFAPGFTQNGI